MEQKPKYTTIIHKIRLNLELSCNEYCLADIIYHLSNNPESKIKGWCYASKETLAEYLGLSKQTIHQIIKKLIEKNLIEKDEQTKWIKTTYTWYENIIMERVKINSKESLPTVKKVYSKQSRKFTPDSKESLHNNNIDNNIDNSLSKDKQDKPVEYGNCSINKIIEKVKEFTGLTNLDDTIGKNRQYAWLLIKNKIIPEFEKRQGNKPTEDEIVYSLEAILRNADRFHRKNITNIKYIYYNFGKLINQNVGGNVKVI